MKNEPQSPRTADVAAGRQDIPLRLALFYAALFIIYGVHVPYWPVWLHGRGLSEAEIAAITAAPFFIRLPVTPAVALWADQHGMHRQIVNALALTSLVAVLVLWAMGTFWPIFAVCVAFALSTSTVMPLTETIAMAQVRATGLDYGRVRLWGSLTFVVMGLVGGAMIDRFGSEASLWLVAAGCAATVAAARGLPAIVKPGGEVAAASVAVLAGTRQEAARIVRSPVFLTFLLASGCTQGAHATFYTFGALHWHRVGISTTWTGVLWGIAVLTEVAMFAVSAAVVARHGPKRLLVAGAAAATVRWAVMSLDPGLEVLVPLQTLHALTYAGTHLGAIHFIARAVPDGAAGTAQALYASIAAGVAMGAATLASGPLYASYGAGAYLGATTLAGIGLVAALALSRMWNGGPIEAEPGSVSPRDRAPAAR